MAYMHIYKDNPTTGSADGTLVSASDESSQITTAALDKTTNEESDPIKLAVRCDTGYVTAANTVITPAGTNYSKWALAPDNSGVPGTWGSYGAALTITSYINTTNTIFWAKAKAASTENPANDSSVNLNGTCAIVNAV